VEGKGAMGCEGGGSEGGAWTRHLVDSGDVELVLEEVVRPEEAEAGRDGGGEGVAGGDSLGEGGEGSSQRRVRRKKARRGRGRRGGRT
jgi:hypothetical protein